MDEFASNSRFEIQRRLGAGGMGIVYKAYDHERKEVVALKTVRETDGELIYRFKNEFRSLADFLHPNFVSLYELISSNGQIFFTMEFIEGVRFDEYILQTRSVSPATSTFSTRTSFSKTRLMLSEISDRTWIQQPTADHDEVIPLDQPQLRRLRYALTQLVTATTALHHAGFLHRDIKPSNVLVTRNGRLVLLDFGLVTKQHHGELSFSTDHRIVGTALYMSPEQAAGLPVGTATDWYSIGVMLYECLVGHCPFEGSPLDVMAKKQSIDPPKPSSLGIAVPDDLDALCVDLLSRTPQSRPLADEIHARLQIESTSSVPAKSDTSHSQLAPFLGRNAQWNDLSAAFANTNRGHVSTAFVQGRSGLGKSTLVRRFLDEVSGDSSVVILSGRCYEQENVPYKALDSVVDALSRYLNKLPQAEADALLPRDVMSLARVFPVLRRVAVIANSLHRETVVPDRQELRQKAFAALKELLARLGDRKTLILYIDDLQWGDLDSAKLLIELLRPPQPPVLLLIICYRSEDRESSVALRALLRETIVNSATVDVKEIEVGPLTYEDSLNLSEQLLHAGDSTATSVADMIAKESEGNPYLIDALVRHYLTSSVNSAPGSMVSLDEMLWARIRALSVSAQRFMEVVAVAGYPIRQAEALQAAGITSETHEILSSLRTARLIRVQGGESHDRVDTYHDRIRESVIAHLSEERCKDCHHRLALALEHSDFVTDPAALGRHFLAAGQRDRAAQYYSTAAKRASEALAFDRAANYYRLALEFGSWDKDSGRMHRKNLARSLADAGRGREAAHEYDQAAVGSSGAESLELRRNASTQLLISGHIDDGLAVLRGVLAEVGMSLSRTPRRALLSLMLQRAKLRLRGFHFGRRDESQIPEELLTQVDVSWSATAGLSIVDTIRGAEFQARCLLLALKAGDPYRISRSLALEAAHVATAGGRAIPRVNQLLALARELGQENAYCDGLTSVMAGLSAFLQGRWRLSLEESDRGEAVLRDNCSGVEWERNTAQGFALWSLHYMGEIAELNWRVPILMNEARERGNLYSLTNLGTFAGSLATLANDDPEQADENLRELMQTWSTGGYHVQHVTSLYGRVQIELYRNDPLAAYQILQKEWPAAKRSQLLRVQQIRIFMSHAAARSALALAVASGDTDTYLRLCTRMIKVLEGEDIAWSLPLAKLIGAGIASVRGNIPKAVTLLKAASNEFEALDMYLYAAASRRRLGGLIGGDEGATLIQFADDWMAGQGIQNPARMTALHAPGF